MHGRFRAITLLPKETDVTVVDCVSFEMNQVRVITLGESLVGEKKNGRLLLVV